MVAAGEHAAEAEDYDQEEGSAQGEAEGWSRCVDVGWGEILALHRVESVLVMLLFGVAVDLIPLR